MSNDDTDTITADTITDAQIIALREEAIEHGDRLQVAYCNLALGYTPSIALTTNRYGARAECARVIRDAQGAS